MKTPIPGAWLLLTGIFAAASGYCAEAPVPAAGIQAYPPTPFVVNVTQPPYSARGDGDPFATLIREQRGDQVKTVKRGEGTTLPYSGSPNSTQPPR